MSTLSKLYRPSLALLTDLYQLTMAQGYWKLGTAEREAVFHLTFRKCPFGGEYAVACGLAFAADLMDQWRFAADDVEYLAGVNGADEKPLFDRGFLNYLTNLEFACDVDGVEEGVAVFPHEPLLRVRGPMLQCQILETALLTGVNFQTLIATKASRICRAARGEPVLEFGLRRAQGVDGGVTASRAAFVGGCAATSNVMAGKLFGIPIKGTHAHSWVMSFDDELESFQAYAESMPNNCVFLVDTYDTVEGVRKAAQVGAWLQEQGHEILGVRLDSGDLAELSRQARTVLDEAGFNNAAIVASNDLDEHRITRLKEQGAEINTWGVGTRLATAYDQPALGGVYKLSAVRDAEQQDWQYKIKLSNEPIKVSNPGIHQIRRYSVNGRFIGDCIYDELLGLHPRGGNAPVEVICFHTAAAETFHPPADAVHEDLLVPLFRGGRRVYESPRLQQTQQRCREQLEKLDGGVLRFEDAQPYRVGLERRLHQRKLSLISGAQKG